LVQGHGDAFNDVPFIEIGGGYGGLCFWIKKVFGGSLSKYYIIDLPWVNTFQAFFLKKVLGNDKVAFWNDDSEKISNAEVILCSAFEYKDYFQKIPLPGIIINQDSMPEMPEAAVKEYIGWLTTFHGSLFFSYQQENGLELNGVSQNSVHAILKEYKNIQLISRNLSWTRNGYTEEAYLVI
jgi:putative sugar O-methyltransferase